MKIAVKTLLFITLCICFSCENQIIIVKCSDCTEEEPLNTNLEIKTDVNQSGGGVLIKVYEGNLEDSILYSSFVVSKLKSEIPVTINKKYTVTASYYIAGNHYIAVDSAIPRVKFDKDKCDNPCYFVYDKVLNLRLKYMK